MKASTNRFGFTSLNIKNHGPGPRSLLASPKTSRAAWTSMNHKGTLTVIWLLGYQAVFAASIEMVVGVLRSLGL